MKDDALSIYGVYGKVYLGFTQQRPPLPKVSIQEQKTKFTAVMRTALSLPGLSGRGRGPPYKHSPLGFCAKRRGLGSGELRRGRVYVLK